MSEVRPLVLPQLEEPSGGSGWISGTSAEEAVPLLDRLQGGSGHAAKRERQPQTGAATQARPQAAAPTKAAGAEASPPADAESGERRISIPPPPGLGALVPGGRSIPPPANDVASQGLEDRVQAFAAAAVELAIARSAVLNSIEGQLLDLAVQIASALIDHEVERDPALQAKLVRAALDTLGDSSRATLRTAPDAFHAIREALGGERIDVNGVRVEIVADASIPGLGCVVDAEHVRVDATVSERLRAVRIAFEDERRRKAGGLE